MVYKRNLKREKEIIIWIMTHKDGVALTTLEKKFGKSMVKSITSNYPVNIIKGPPMRIVVKNYIPDWHEK